MKQFSLKIPEWKDVVKLGKIIHYKVTGGFTCTLCGNKSKFNHVQFEADVNGQRLIFQNNTRGMCADCTMEELDENANIVYNIPTCECDWCNEIKPTATFIRHKEIKSFVTFGDRWWNGSNICQDCMNIGIKDGKHKLKSSIYHLGKDGKSYPINELGLIVKK